MTRFKQTVLFALLFIVIAIPTNALLTERFNSEVVVTSIIAGLIFGFLVSSVLKLIARKKIKGIQTPLGAGESVILEDAANHLVGTEGVGGKLALTNEKLYFRSHGFNINTHESSIPRERIVKLQSGSSFLNNLLTVELDDDTVEKFIVDSPETWIRSLTKKN